MKTTDKEANAIRAQYHHDSIGKIIQPGKFQGQPIFAPYFWNIGLDGLADNDDDLTYTFKFKKGCADFLTWPELQPWLGTRRTLKLQEDSAGFVSCFTSI